MTLTELNEILLAKAHQSEKLHEMHDLIEFFFYRLDMTLRRSMRGYWASRKTASFHDLAFNATTFPKLQGGLKGL